MHTETERLSIGVYTVKITHPRDVQVHLKNAGQLLNAREVEDDGLRGAHVLTGDLVIADMEIQPREGYPVLVYLGPGRGFVARLYAVGPAGPELRATGPDYPILRAVPLTRAGLQPGEGDVSGVIVGLIRAPAGAERFVFSDRAGQP